MKTITLVGEMHYANNGARKWIAQQNTNICCEFEPSIVEFHKLIFKDNSYEDMLAKMSGIPSSILLTELMQSTKSNSKNLYGVDCGPACTSYVQKIMSYVTKEPNIETGQVTEKITWDMIETVRASLSTVLPTRESTKEELTAKLQEKDVPETTIEALYDDVKSLSIKNENNIWAKDIRDALMAQRIVKHGNENEGDMIMLVGLGHLIGLVKHIEQLNWGGDIKVKLSGAVDNDGELRTIEYAKGLEAEGISYKYLDEDGVEYEGLSGTIASINAKKKKESLGVSHDKLTIGENEGINTSATGIIPSTVVEDEIKSEKENSEGDIEDAEAILQGIRQRIGEDGPEYEKYKGHPDAHLMMTLPTFRLLQRKLLKRLSKKRTGELPKNVRGSQSSNVYSEAQAKKLIPK